MQPRSARRARAVREGYAEQFLAEYLAFDGTPEALLGPPRDPAGEYQSEGSLNIPRLQHRAATRRAHALSPSPLVEELWERWHDAQFAELEDLAAYSEAD